jgi:hypothetical protein
MKLTKVVSLALLVAGCAARPAIGGQEIAVLQRATFDLGCQRDQISVQRLGPPGRAATYGALGCGKKASYVAAECEVHPLTQEFMNCQAILNSETKPAR